MPAFQRPFPLFQHKALVFVGSQDIALTNFQSLNDFPTVWLLDGIKKHSGARFNLNTLTTGSHIRYVA